MKPPLLAVTGSQKPYLFDLPHLLSLPDGFEFRFRYRPSWVDRALIDECGPAESAFSDRDVIILFHSQESRRIIPVRKATVIGLEQVGPMLLFRFRVGAFVNVALDLNTYSYSKAENGLPNSDVTAAVSQLSQLATLVMGPIDGKADFDLASPLPSGWYLRPAAKHCPKESWAQNDPAAAWARVVAVLQNDSSLEGVPFFYLLGFRTESGTTVNPSAVKNRFSLTKEPIYGFSLNETDRYRMRLLEWCEHPRTEPAPLVSVDCEFSKKNLALEGKSNLVVGRYDVVEFTFSARQPGYCEVSLSAEPSKVGSTNDRLPSAGTKKPSWCDWPTIFVARVPIIVSPKPRKIFMISLVAAAGLAVYAFVAPRVEPHDATWASFLQVLGLAMMLPLADLVKKYLELQDNVEKLTGPPKG